MLAWLLLVLLRYHQLLGIDEAYLAVVRAKDFVKSLLMTEDNNLRTQVFEENVRSFLGDDNPVNVSIAETLRSDKSSRFPVLNNGITIVCPDVRLQGTTLHLANYQIVNGCQTSNILFENYDVLEDVMVTIKVVKTQNEDVFAELVRATNSQTRIDENQFLALRPIIKRVEQYFNTYNDSESCLYFERRDRQYVGRDIPATRIYSVHYAAKCVASMFCNRPDLAARYPKKMYEELTDNMFGEGVKEAVFYASCLTMYRFNLLIANGNIDRSARRFKWHVLPLARRSICGSHDSNLNSRDAERQSNDVISTMQNSRDAQVHFNKVVDLFNQVGEVTRDRLKRQAILNELFLLL